MRRLIAMVFIVSCLSAIAETQEFKSGAEQSALFELFSSEGCSSCPPAEALMVTLNDSPDLWSKFVPVEFHVDYWNYIGWADPFSSPDYSQRQRQYAARWGSQSVYTPGFVVNGAELKNWSREALNRLPSTTVGVLSAKHIGSDLKFDLSFTQVKGVTAKNLVCFGVLMNNGVSVHVARGENAQKTLRHEFVARVLKSQPATRSNSDYRCSIDLGNSKNAPRQSVAFWMADQDTGRPVQATGGFLGEAPTADQKSLSK